jgi:hypothetical protein
VHFDQVPGTDSLSVGTLPISPTTLAPGSTVCGTLVDPLEFELTYNAAWGFAPPNRAGPRGIRDARGLRGTIRELAAATEFSEGKMGIIRL